MYFCVVFSKLGINTQRHVKVKLVVKSFDSLFHDLLGVLFIPLGYQSDNLIMELTYGLNPVLPTERYPTVKAVDPCRLVKRRELVFVTTQTVICLLYTSDAADE